MAAAKNEEQNAWDAKLDRALFSGNCNQPETSPRPRLVKVAAAHPDLIFVNKIVAGTEESKKSCVNDVFKGVEALEAEGRGAVIDRCSFRMEEVCRYKYLINVSPGKEGEGGSFGGGGGGGQGI